MSGLDRINGEALSVPGLRFWGGPIPVGFRIVAQNELGAIELWEGHGMGAVEVHSPLPVTGDEPIDCEILGGDCWADGSTMAYPSTFKPLIRAGDSTAVLRKLADWHNSQFGER